MMYNEDKQQSYKYSNWVCTIKTPLDKSIELPDPVQVVRVFREFCSDYTFQEEVSSNGMKHFQCAFKTKIRKMQQTVLNDIARELDYPLNLVEVDRSQDFAAAVNYCSDKSKRSENSAVYTTNTSLKYSESDIIFLDDKANRYPWQNKFMFEFFDESEVNFKTPDDRTIYWVQDSAGNSGKSKFAKWLVRRYPNSTKIAFGTSTQLRASVIDEGSQQFYILDIPRTLGSDDSMSSVISVIEDIKNGYVKSGMYGKSAELFIEPPHIVVLTNKECPTNLLSEDRWRVYSINRSKDWFCCSSYMSPQNVL